jgi:hypothetical protein
MIIEHDPLGIVVRWPRSDCWLLIDPEHVCLVYRGKLILKLRAARSGFAVA